MKTLIAVGLAALAATAANASPIYAASTVRTTSAQHRSQGVLPTSAQPCSPSSSKLGSGTAVGYCGPATATLAIGGKTYKFKNGFCQSIHVSGIKLDLTLGTIVQSKTGTLVRGNAGKPYFSLDISPGPYSSILNPVYSGGRSLSSGDTISYTGGVKTKGTFKDTSGKFSGSWNCHGVFVNH